MCALTRFRVIMFGRAITVVATVAVALTLHLCMAAVATVAVGFRLHLRMAVAVTVAVAFILHLRIAAVAAAEAEGKGE